MFFKVFFSINFLLLKIIEGYGEESYSNRETTLSYVLQAGETPRQKELYEAITELKTVNEEKLMTLVEHLKPEIYKRGLEQGVAQGAEKSKVEIASNMLEKGFDPQLVSSITGLSQEEVLQLRY